MTHSSASVLTCSTYLGEPMTSGALQTANSGGTDAFVAKINMGAGACTYQLSATSQSFDYSGGTGSLTITAPAGCAWTASATDAWITITTGSSGSGSGTVSFSVAANDGSHQSRSTGIGIGGENFTISQDGAPCTYTLEPISRSFTAEGGVCSVTVRTPSGCSWTSTSDISWASGSASGDGTGSVVITVATNAGAARTGKVTAGGQVFTVSQEAAANFRQPADFNGDGLPDVIWQDAVSGWAQVWYLGGANGVTSIGAANLTARNTWRIVGVGDFDRDGHPDVVWQDPVSGAAQVWFLGGSGGNEITRAAVLSNGNSWRIMSIADFNGDGIPDCIWQDQSSGWAQIWFMGGPQGTAVTGAVNLTARNTWRIAGTGDFNGDGVPDVAWQDPITGATQVWYLGGAQGNVVQDAVNLANNTWKVAAIADFDGDGHPDVVWQDPGSGAAQVWFLGGAQGTTATGSASVSTGNTWRIMGPR